MKKRTNSLSLLKLYFNYCINIKSLVILGVSLIIMTITILLLCKNSESTEYYLINYDAIHTNYLNQSVLIIEIVNSFIIACMVNQITVSQSSFDSLFVSYISRIEVSIIKIISILLLVFFYILIEVIIISVIGYFSYIYYKSNSIALATFLYLVQFGVIQISIAFFISILINNNFSTIISFIIFVASIFLKDNLASKIDIFNKIIPIYDMSAANLELPYIGYGVTIVFLILFILMFKVKNIKI